MAESTANVVAIGSRSWRRAQESRRATVRAALVDARGWIDAGLAGEVPLEVAVCTADAALGPALHEVLRASLTA